VFGATAVQNAAVYTAAKARLADTQVGMAVHSATSEPMAAKPAKPGMPPSLERSSPSSVGQSIYMMRMGVCMPCAVNLAPASSSGALSKGGIDGAAQQSPSA